MNYTTTCISKDQMVNAINAFAFSEALHIPLTAFFTVDWEPTDRFDETYLGARLGSLLHRFSRWCRATQIRCAYVWTKERCGVRGIHTHFLLHVPHPLFHALNERFPTWIEGYQP